MDYDVSLTTCTRRKWCPTITRFAHDLATDAVRLRLRLTERAYRFTCSVRIRTGTRGMDTTQARIASNHLPLDVDLAIGNKMRTSTPPSG
ncbi:hypothetical protein Poly51_55330 [Rubripirellula tenax]|uniref:Uncharacterized protein n=1 Tax=Rubripirellula tenax TaxID=2528015 RepID=A0A5C6EB78_9BACT|nr:hypothetical protein Poly51_55330 [Rubripirellula tenax]